MAFCTPSRRQVLRGDECSPGCSACAEQRAVDAAERQRAFARYYAIPQNPVAKAPTTPKADLPTFVITPPTPKMLPVSPTDALQQAAQIARDAQTRVLVTVGAAVAFLIFLATSTALAHH